MLVICDLIVLVLSGLAIWKSAQFPLQNPKHIVEIFMTNTYPGGYWVDQGYNRFGGA
jgi:DMSO/TMAO reductase YedYZ molybdopterin-dependent catalytic subunit